MEERLDKRSRRTRLWVIPPGLRAGDEPFESYRVLEEVRAGVGVTLWQVLRDTDLWSITPPEVRSRLFAPALVRRRRASMTELGLAREVRIPLDKIGRALEGRTRNNPGTQVTRACQALSRWAGDHGMPRTALAFAQSAALATPDQAGPAYLVGLLARRNAEYRRAETWFRRALGLARRSEDWPAWGSATCTASGATIPRRASGTSARCAWPGATRWPTCARWHCTTCSA
jgi:hypothetical protein